VTFHFKFLKFVYIHPTNQPTINLLPIQQPFINLTKILYQIVYQRHIQPSSNTPTITYRLKKRDHSHTSTATNISAGLIYGSCLRVSAENSSASTTEAYTHCKSSFNVAPKDSMEQACALHVNTFINPEPYELLLLLLHLTCAINSHGPVLLILMSQRVFGCDMNANGARVGKLWGRFPLQY
jgi:hypothetical protein